MSALPPRTMSRAVMDERSDSLDQLQQLIDHAAHLLPAQGPIPVFIHHNTLHAFEDENFLDAVVRGGEIFGCEPFLSEDRYRDEIVRGRIRFEDLDAALREDLGAKADQQVAPGCTRFELRQLMLHIPLRVGTSNELLWFVAETDALRRVADHVSASQRAKLISETRLWAMRDLRGQNGSRGAIENDGFADLIERIRPGHMERWGLDDWEALGLHALWRACRAGVDGVPQVASPPKLPIRHRDLLFRVSGAGSDQPVHDLLIRLCAAFLDQGLGHWAMPNRELGFFGAFAELYRSGAGSPDPWRRGLPAELRRVEFAKLTPLESIRESLELLGVPKVEWGDFLSATLLALRGWAGITRLLEERPDRAVHAPSKGSLVEFLAVRLILDRLSLAYVARKAIGYTGPLNKLRDELRSRIPPYLPPSTEQRAFPIFQIAQGLGWTAEVMSYFGDEVWQSLVREVEEFSSIARRRVFHLAYERRFYVRSLDAIGLHASKPTSTPRLARFQAVFCIDEREESIRRHLEESAPDVETFGTAGFFSVAMYYKGAADAHFTPLCPAVFLPKHWVTEEVVELREDEHLWRTKLRRAVGSARYHVHVGSRRFMAAALLALTGVLASVPLVARTLFPRLTARFHKHIGGLVRASTTRLRLERTDPTPGPEGSQVGYTLDELVVIGEKLLRDIGLISGFSRIVFVFGHGSTSMNNPHESAHDCGACGGSRGGPNARALAHLLNDPRVRERLSQRGIAIPQETWFIGGMHNTSSEELTLADVDRLPEHLQTDFERAYADLQTACDRDAHERARRFESAPLTLSVDGARRHMEGRAEDLSQVRPEWGHATNAICIVGRRERTKGLFLDRRAFLNSYDPTQDDADAMVLTRTLQAVFPVCGGINLEYYFSYVDNAGYGCGTKLPHNITSLLGVMDGAGSDLRTGLPWQMVEIHEPVRLLVIVETWPEVILRILDKHPALGRLARNGWIQLALLDPDSPSIQIYRNGAFVRHDLQAKELPRAASSIDWYRGLRDHLEFAAIGN